jgi:TolA-binding protein
MAEIQLEGMGRPDKALDILDHSKWRRKSIENRAKVMRAKAFSISDRRAEAEKELKTLVLVSDSTIVPEVEFRLSELHFYSGKYSMALAGFSKLAEEYSSNNSANDALELAMLIKQEIDKEKGALDLFASARFFDNRGKLINAIDSLGMLEERFPESPLLPRALLWRSSLEIEAGMNNIAEADLARLAERYPMSVYAPEALERIGDFVSPNRPEEALKKYGESIERYPDNPFISRVRRKYVNLSKELKLNSRGKAGTN